MRYITSAQTRLGAPSVRPIIRSRPQRATRGDHAKGDRLSEAIGSEPEKARPEAESQTFRILGPRGRVRTLIDLRPVLQFASEFRVSEAFTNDLPYEVAKPVCIGHRQTVVIAEGLLVNIAEQVERLNRNVGAIDTALQEAPEVFAVVSMAIFPGHTLQRD